VAVSYDLVVIGGGPGGEKAAVAAAFFGRKVALVERSKDGPGGATVHTGTLPSKTLRETALYLTGFQKRELYEGLSAEIDPSKRSAKALMCRLPAVRKTQSHQIMQNLERHGVEVLRGSARFESPHVLRVDGKKVESQFVLIATGSSPFRPKDFDFSDREVFDSDSILHLDKLPESLAVIGGGVIGSEYACVFSALGVKIDVIERRDRLLGFLDRDVSDALMASMRAEGITLHLSDGVASVVREGADLILTLKSGNRRKVDKVLVSAGRTGNTDELDVGKAGVKVDDKKLVVVDGQYKSSAESVYAVGDVIGSPALASTAMEQGRLAVSHMFGIAVPPRDFAAIPSGIYTIPEACSCGPTEQELVEKGVRYVTGKSYMRHNARGQIIGDTDGFIKLLFSADDRRLLGTHIIAERATELIHIGQAVMRLGGGIDYFIESVMTYPSLSVAYKYAAYEALGKQLGVPILPAPLE
jgi:NAD(P) transhydrogenase